MSIRFRPSKCEIVIFLTAMIIRGGLFVCTLNKPEVMLQPDSRMYVSLSEGLLENGTMSYPGIHQAPSADRTPGYPAFLAAILWAFGGSLLAVVLVQIFVDSLSCVLVCKLGEMLGQGNGFLGGILRPLHNLPENVRSDLGA